MKDNDTREQTIEVEGLTKYYGEFLAVDRVRFSVRKGEVFGFLGPNGAGKTTTVRMLTGILKPTDGTARIMGYDIRKQPLDAKQLMGIVPEMSNAYIDLSAWDNMMLMGALYGVPRKKRKEKACSLLKMFGLYEKKAQKAKVFSKGMKQRLILCMALIHEPEVLFLDEPTSGLDVQSTRLIRNLIGELSVQGATVFLTTHNIEEANQMCGRVAIIDHGRIAAIDRPENLRRTFQSVQSVEVAFDRPSEALDALRKLPGVREAKKQGDKFRLYTADIHRVLYHVTDYAKANDLHIVTLNTLGPSLEDVFVQLTEAHH